MAAHADDISDFVNGPAKPKKSGGRFTLFRLLTFIGILVLLIALLLPLSRGSRGAARRAQCVNNLKQIALALDNYERTYNALPPAYTVDAAGKPLHSWRTLILPYLEQRSLYETIDLSKSWNDPVNAKAYAKDVEAFRCPELNRPCHTTYLAVVASNSCFLPDEPRRLADVSDDRGLTLSVIEASLDQAVHWMAPTDADESLVMGLTPRSKLSHSGGTNAAFLDGGIHFLKATSPSPQRRAMISIAGSDDKAAGIRD